MITRACCWLALLLVLSGCLLSLPRCGAAERSTERPNVILILADDLGQETLGIYGGESYRTPHLDALARSGRWFNHCYAQPLCTPTRVQLMTGRSNIRNYIRFGEFPQRERTFAHYFQTAGYATGIAGKWQLGREVDLPQRLGFDDAFLWQHTRRPPRYANPGLEHNGKSLDFSQGEYGPDLIQTFAEQFIERHADRPFLLYYPMVLTHSPFQPTPDSPDWDPRAIGEKVHQSPKHFRSMVEYMDRHVGRLVATLERLSLRDRTLIIFLGDNGTGKGLTSQWQGQPYVGGKGSTTRAGMRVPCIISWPGHFPATGPSEQLVDTTDILPTLLEAIGHPLPTDVEWDGFSLVPVLQGSTEEKRTVIYSWYSPRQGEDRAVREFAFDRQYKLYRQGRFFDLTADPDEKMPLDVAQLTDEARRRHQHLSEALARYKNARPAELDAR